MHVLYLHQYFVPPDGTGGTRSLELARRFVRDGHAVTVVTSSAFFPDRYAFEPGVNTLDVDGVEVRVVHVPYGNRMGVRQRLGAFARFAALCAREACRVRDVDVVFATSTPLTIALPGAVARRWHRAPMVFEVRDLWPEVPVALGYLRHPALRRAAEALERWAYAESSRVVALSPGMRDGVVAQGVASDRVTVAPNGADVDLFEPDPAPVVEPPTVAYVGTLGVVNGCDYFVGLAEAVERRGADVRFVLVGDGNQRERVVRAAEAAGVLGRTLRVLPPVPKGEIPAVLAGATMASSTVQDVPALWHNSANKFFDALAAGKPVMLNHEGWQADLVREERIGVVLPPHDFDAAAEALTAFLADAGAVRQAGARARRLAEERFSRGAMAQRVLGVLEEAVRESAASRARRSPATALYRRFGKRLADIVASGAALLALAPALAVVAAAVRLDSPGPVFFSQERLGRGGRVFRVLKFRTMTDRPRRTEGEVVGRAPDVTRVGYWLRRLKVDELPQLWNVLRGDMSLVGPRPALPDHLGAYDAEARRRLDVRPGLTGLAQVNGNIHLAWEDRWVYDARYVGAYSLALDAAIVLRTLRVILHGEDAFLCPPSDAR